MADRRAQLLEAAKKHEEEAVDTADESDIIAEGSDENASLDDNEPILGSGDDSKTPKDSGTGEESDKDDGAGVSGRGKKPVTGLDPSKSGDGKGASKVLAKPDAPKGAKENAGPAKTLEQTEKEAAEAGEAPKAWRPIEREHWTKIPKEAREAINRRETEITQFIGRHGAAIQHKAQFDETVQPFMPFIAAQQSTPMKAFHSLMTTAARLTTSSPQGKAAVIAEIMQNYGVDAATLDEVLTLRLQGKPVSNGQPPQQFDTRPPQWAQPILSFMQETQQARQAREQRIQEEAAREIAAFEKKPFFHDLRADIQFLMERATTKGEVMTMDQAYVKARKMNPEIDQILTQREKAATSNGSEALTRARRAASTIKGAPSSGTSSNGTAIKKNGAGDKPLSRREAMAAAFDELKED